ncbi:MAG: Txe/YoeB family addiction module toxin [Bernardetiaceae bacterium]|jgi:toxin YoeB|nr:Txe/YoeB family addiction module toxin [Bernardetiaceae bacterium]
MEIVFTPQAREHLDFWIATGNKPVLKRIAKLTEAILANPFQGIGKPEGLKHALAGKWSRRINAEHHFIYQVEGEVLWCIHSKVITIDLK